MVQNMEEQMHCDINIAGGDIKKGWVFAAMLQMEGRWKAEAICEIVLIW